MKDQNKFIEKIEKAAAQWDISAVLSVTDSDGFRYEKAFGYADRASGRPMTLADRFCLDTENGFFLALCVMHLAERKKLRLSDRISRFIPEYRHAERIAVRDLLRWASGIEDHWRAVLMPRLQKDPAHAALSVHDRFRRESELHARDIPFADVLKDIGELDLTHEPGREDDGSESNTAFLAEIVRRASGMPVREYVFRHFFEPLGMADTGPGNDATTALYGVVRDTELVSLPPLSPAGAFTTTLADMDKLARALAGKQFFTERTWAAMLKCRWRTNAIGFSKRGELYAADFYPCRLRDTCQLYLNFDEGVSILLLNNEELKFRLEPSGHWRHFCSDLRRAWQDARVYPDKPELKRVTAKNVWDAMDIELAPEQLAFIPECSKCIAYMLAERQPVYVLMDHGVPIGMTALIIKPKKKQYDVGYLQVDRRYQGRGYGRILLLRAMEILKEKGAEALEIGVVRHNTAAYRLYRSVGFEDKEVYDDFISMKMTL